MSYAVPPIPGMSLLQDDLLTRGVLSRRFFAWLVDITVVALLCFSFYLAFLTLGFLTLGLGWTLFGVLPFVPSLYMGLSLVSPMGATPGQALFGLIVARNDDLGPPILAQVVVCVVVYVVTLPVLWISVLLALVTSRRRTLHDLLSGLVVVRRRALEVPLTAGGPHWTMNGSNIPPGSRPAA